MKTYSKTHKSPKALKSHVTKIKARGGKATVKGNTVEYKFGDGGNVLPKYAGQTEIPLGAKVMIIKGGDKGLSGKATHPFAFGETKKGWIGIYLDKEGVYTDNKMNEHVGNLKVIVR
jgi:hypothetical protein